MVKRKKLKRNDPSEIENSWTITDEEFINSNALNQTQVTGICNKNNPELVKRGYDKQIF